MLGKVVVVVHLAHTDERRPPFQRAYGPQVSVEEVLAAALVHFGTQTTCKLMDTDGNVVASGTVGELLERGMSGNQRDRVAEQPTIGQVVLGLVPLADDELAEAAASAACEHPADAVFWNPYNQVVQCHRCGARRDA